MLRRELLRNLLGLMALPLVALPKLAKGGVAARGIDMGIGHCTAGTMVDGEQNTYLVQAAHADAHCVVLDQRSGLVKFVELLPGGRHRPECICAMGAGTVEIVTERLNGMIHTVDIRRV